jgi:hypothetical protein
LFNLFKVFLLIIEHCKQKGSKNCLKRCLNILRRQRCQNSAKFYFIWLPESWKLIDKQKYIGISKIGPMLIFLYSPMFICIKFGAFRIFWGIFLTIITVLVLLQDRFQKHFSYCGKSERIFVHGVSTADILVTFFSSFSNFHNLTVN